MLLVSAALLFLALATYTPTDPSANTVGNYAAGARSSAGLATRLAAGPAHNWTGLAGAWLADLILQTIGIAAFFLPIVLGRLGLCWMRQRPAGSAMARLLGLGLWIVFAPAAIGLLPRTLYWRHALPIEGVTGRLLADAMVQYLNLPGASIVLALMVVLSVYLATTFTFHTAREWMETHFSLLRSLFDRLRNWRARRALARAEKRALQQHIALRQQADSLEHAPALEPALTLQPALTPEPSHEVFTSRREQALEQAGMELELQHKRVADPTPSTLLGLSLRLDGTQAPPADSARHAARCRRRSACRSARLGLAVHAAHSCRCAPRDRAQHRSRRRRALRRRAGRRRRPAQRPQCRRVRAPRTSQSSSRAQQYIFLQGLN